MVKIFGYKNPSIPSVLQGYDPCLNQFLQGHQNTKFCMVPGQSALEIHGIRRLDRAICAQFDRRALDESACCHDDRRIVARHIPRFRGDEAVYRCRRLNALAECDHALCRAKGNCLDDVVAGFGAVRNDCKAKLLINICCKDRTL